MNVSLPYGKTSVRVHIPSANVKVIEPAFVNGLPDERAAFAESVNNPIKSPPLSKIISTTETLAVVIPDITRPFPSYRILPWLFEELKHVSPARLTIIVGTGSHRASTDSELETLVGKDIMDRFRVVNHDAHDMSTMSEAGCSADGNPVFLNTHYVRADRRIIMGFIEPHFMAGFSGGYKAVFPGIGDIDAIMRYHGADIIGDPRSTWGLLDGNPTQETVRHNGSLLPIDFCINVTLNRDRKITGFFSGETSSAHRAGCAAARDVCMVRCEQRFPVVITTNGGHPLDQNLYQTVKGMSAAAQIIEAGGQMIVASECADGFPAHGNFKKLLFEHQSPEALLETINTPGFSLFDQWEAQILASILRQCRASVFSSIPEPEISKSHMTHVPDLQHCIDLAVNTPDMPVAVLPEGPLTIPYSDQALTQGTSPHVS